MTKTILVDEFERDENDIFTKVNEEPDVAEKLVWWEDQNTGRHVDAPSVIKE
jgi:hypothetical protein